MLVRQHSTMQIYRIIRIHYQAAATPVLLPPQEPMVYWLLHIFLKAKSQFVSQMTARLLLINELTSAPKSQPLTDPSPLAHPPNHPQRLQRSRQT